MDVGLIWRLLMFVWCVIPALISRDQRFSVNPDVVLTNQSHREYLYRQSFVVDRHVAGYEVQKLLAAVDLLVPWLRSALGEGASVELPIGVGGVGEGGRIALASADGIWRCGAGRHGGSAASGAGGLSAWA